MGCPISEREKKGKIKKREGKREEKIGERRERRVGPTWTVVVTRARPDSVGESEPKPRGHPFNFFIFILHVIKFSFSKVSRPESPARPEGRVRTGARFTLTFSFYLIKTFIYVISF